MSFFSFAKRNKESYSLVFNVGSGSVSGGIIRFTEKEGVNMIYYAKEIIPFQNDVIVSRHILLMKDSLTKLAHKIRVEGFKKVPANNTDFPIERAFYVFSSPWSNSQTKTIKIHEPKPFKITEAYLNKLVDSQEKEFQTELGKTGKIIEKKIIQIKINGYEVSNAINMSTKDLEISVFFTMVAEDILHLVNEAVTKTFHIKNSWCHSLSLAVFSTVRNLFPQFEDFIHIDVSEELTDICIIRDNIMTSMATIPFGRNHFIRNLSNSLKVSEEVADSMINMHAQKSNDELANLRLGVSMDAAAKDWLSRLFEILDSFKEKIYVPESIFLVINNDLNSFLKDKLEKHDFTVTALSNNKIKPISPGDDIMFKLELMFLDNLYKI
jgi:hypothetical protein